MSSIAKSVVLIMMVMLLCASPFAGTAAGSYPAEAIPGSGGPVLDHVATIVSLGGVQLESFSTQGALAAFTSADYLALYHIADPANPRPVSFTKFSDATLGGFLGGTVYLQDRYAYLLARIIPPGQEFAIKTAFYVFDILDPVHPQVTGSLFIDGFRQGFTVQGNSAYIAINSLIVILDLSDPTNPHQIQTINENATALRSLVNPNTGKALLYAAHNLGASSVDLTDGTVSIYDISMPGSPQPLNTDIFLRGGSDLAVQYSTATGKLLAYSPYTAYEPYPQPSLGGLYILDVTNPTSPVTVADFSLPVGVNRITVNGGLAFAADINTGISYAVDIANPSAPVLLGNYPAVVSTPLTNSNYLAASSLGFEVVDYSTSSAPKRSSLISRFGVIVNNDMAAFGNYLVSEGQVYDMTNPFAPQIVATIPGGTLIVAAAGPYLVNYQIQSPITIFDMSNPLSPQKVAEIPIRRTPAPWNLLVRGVPGSGEPAYLLIPWLSTSDPTHPNGIGGFDIYNISNPAAPQVVNLYTAPNGVIASTIDDRYAYFMYGNGWTGPYSMGVLDLANPAAPKLMGSVPLPGNHSQYPGIDIANKTIFLAYFNYDENTYTRSNGLVVIDASNPAKPRELGRYLDGEDITDLQVDGNYLYASGNNLWVFDISNPASLKLVNIYSPNGNDDPHRSSILFFYSKYLHLSQGEESFIYVRGMTDGAALDASGRPVAGVRITASAAGATYTTFSGIYGLYAFANLPAGAYTLTPSLAGYRFSPATRQFTPGTGPGGQNFTVLPNPVSINLTGADATLSYTEAQGKVTALGIPAGAATVSATLRVTPQSGGDRPGWAFLGHAFDIELLQGETEQPGATFAQPVNVSVAADTHRAWDLSLIQLQRWTGSEWAPAGATCTPASQTQVDRSQGVVSVGVCQAGQYALYGPSHFLFASLILR
jgi:hypothetical protein